MIILLTGGIGSGKTLTAVKEIIKRKNKVFTNFDLYGYPYTRLKHEHLFQTDKKTKKIKLNFDFWNKETKKGRFDIFLDEFHNTMGSRRAMSKKNVLMSDWLSQIRKILGASEKNHLYLITQKLRRIDVNSRDLAHLAVRCEKETYEDVKIPTEVRYKGKLITKRMPMVMITEYFFQDADALSRSEEHGIRSKIGCRRFIANLYYKYYDSYELIDFGSQDYV